MTKTDKENIIFLKTRIKNTKIQRISHFMVELEKFRSKPKLGLNWESCIFWYYAYKWNLTFYVLHCYLNLSRLRLQVKVSSSPHFGSKMIVLGSLLIPVVGIGVKNNRQSVRDEKPGKSTRFTSRSKTTKSLEIL